MDDVHIQQLAAQHLEQIAEARRAAALRVAPTPNEVWDRHIGALFGALEVESRVWSAAYNAAIGSEKLECDNEEGCNVNVTLTANYRDGARLHLDPPKRRVARCQIELESGTHEKIPIAIRVVGERLVLFLDDDPVSATVAMNALLERFTTLLTEAECSAL